MVTCTVSVRVASDRPCGAVATTHVMLRAACGKWATGLMCARHALDIAGGRRTFVDRCSTGPHLHAHVADHRISPECRHPDGEWDDDRCVIPGLMTGADLVRSWVGTRPEDGRPVHHDPEQQEDDTMTDLSEAQFQQQVVGLARLAGWTVAHFRPAQNSRGEWRTPVAADGKGFPDLVLTHPRGGVLFRELKAKRGRLTPEQHQWITTLTASGADAAVWRPADWDAIERTLTAPRRAGRSSTPLTDRIAAAAEAAELDRRALGEPS